MLKPILSDLVDVTDHALGAAVVSVDGLVIDAHDATGMDPEPAHALPEFGQVIRQLRAINEGFPLGDLLVTEVRSGERITLLRQLDAHYLLAMWVRPDASVSKARFRMRLASPDIAIHL